jgi:hypothetical protein
VHARDLWLGDGASWQDALCWGALPLSRPYLHSHRDLQQHHGRAHLRRGRVRNHLPLFSSLRIAHVRGIPLASLAKYVPGTFYGTCRGCFRWPNVLQQGFYALIKVVHNSDVETLPLQFLNRRGLHTLLSYTCMRCRARARTHTHVHTHAHTHTHTHHITSHHITGIMGRATTLGPLALTASTRPGTSHSASASGATALTGSRHRQQWAVFQSISVPSPTAPTGTMERWHCRRCSWLISEIPLRAYAPPFVQFAPPFVQCARVVRASSLCVSWRIRLYT